MFPAYLKNPLEARHHISLYNLRCFVEFLEHFWGFRMFDLLRKTVSETKLGTEKVVRGRKKTERELF